MTEGVDNKPGQRVGGITGKGFQPGQSGNPGGRAKGLAEVRELARSLAPDAFKALGEVLRNKRAPASARVAAAGVVLDRGYGKAIQPVELSDNRPLAGVPAERLLAALDALAAAAGRGGE